MPTMPADEIKKIPVMQTISGIIQDMLERTKDIHLVKCSNLQTQIDLSTTEAEYITLNQAMREVIHFIELMN